jgi:hypothetical protein
LRFSYHPPGDELGEIANWTTTVTWWVHGKGEQFKRVCQANYLTKQGEDL